MDKTDQRTLADRHRKKSELLASLLVGGSAQRWCSDWTTVEQFIREEHGRVQTINALHLHRFCNSADFRAATERAQLLTADGWPVALAVGAVQRRWFKRITGSDLCLKLLEPEYCPHIKRIVIVGGAPAAVEAYGEQLRGSDRTLVWSESGDIVQKDAQRLRSAVEASCPDLTLVALPTDLGESIADVVAASGTCVVVCIGAGIEMATGYITRAPVLAQRLGAEWIWRIVREPGRMWRRYILECLPVVLTELPLAVIVAWRRRR